MNNTLRFITFFNDVSNTNWPTR